MRADPIDADQKLQEDALMSYVASVNYSYDDKYYASFSFRRDGSSRLSPDTRWGNFWSLSASWRLSQERFMQSLKSVLSDLKLRASYGVNGNLLLHIMVIRVLIPRGRFIVGNLLRGKVHWGMRNSPGRRIMH